MSLELEPRNQVTATGSRNILDSEGNITRVNNVSCTVSAADAKEYIDPAEVKKAIDELLKAFEDNIKKIQKAILNVSVDAGGQMLSVRDATMEPVLQSYASGLDEIPLLVTSGIEEGVGEELGIYDKAVKYYNDKQTVYNGKAEEKAREGCINNGADPNKPIEIITKPIG